MTREELDAALDAIAAEPWDESSKLTVACHFVALAEEPCTLGQIAKVLGVSRERVRVIIAQALDAARRETLGLHRRPLREVLSDRDFMDSIRVISAGEEDRDGDVLRIVRSFDGSGPAAAVAERLGVHESTAAESLTRLRAKKLVELVAGPWGGWVAA